MEKKFENLARELEIDVIDEALSAQDFYSLSSQLNLLINEIIQGLNHFDSIKLDPEVQSIGQIRANLKKYNIDLTQLGLKGYYFIEKYKEFIANKTFTYTLAAQKGDKSETIQRVDNLSLQEMLLFIGKVQKTRSSDGSNAILSGSISTKKLLDFGLKSNLTDEQILLYKKMYQEGHGLKKGIIYEAFEHALADGATSQTRSFKKYFNAASGNIPFYKFAGDVKGVQVKFGGFTLAHISTILTVLQYLQMIFILINSGKERLAQRLQNIVFKQKISANTTAKKLYTFIEKYVRKDIKEEFSKIPGVQVNIT